MLILILCTLLIPAVIGSGVLRILYGNEKNSGFHIWDKMITGVITVLFLGEVSHLCSLILHRSFSFFTGLFAALTLVMAGAASATIVCTRRKEKAAPSKAGGGNVLIFAPALLLFGLQTAYILLGTPFLQGDMTVETVNSFLQTDGIYQVNPMTGSPYQGGIPLRLKILALPSLYGGLCRFFSLNPQEVVWRFVPCVTLACFYGAFSCLGRCLFPEDEKKRSCFLALAGLLLWAGNYAVGMDGFDLLNCGWRGTAVRNAILAPWLISLCLRKKRMLAIMCIAAEACMVWTFYGAGVCLAVTAVMAVPDIVRLARTALKGKEAPK